MVVDIAPDLTVYLLLNVILTEFIRVVIAGGKESVVTQQIIALVRIAQTTNVFTKSGMNQMVHRSGDTTEGVVNGTLYLTVHLLNVILTGNIRVVVNMAVVATIHLIVYALNVLTTGFLQK